MEVLKHIPRIDLNRDIVRSSPRGIPVIDLNAKLNQEPIVSSSRPPCIHLNGQDVFIAQVKIPRVHLNPTQQKAA